MSAFTIHRHGQSRFWAVQDATGVLACVCVYKRGAAEVVRRLTAAEPVCLRESPAAEFSATPVDRPGPPTERGSVR